MAKTNGKVEPSLIPEGADYLMHNTRQQGGRCTRFTATHPDPDNPNFTAILERRWEILEMWNQLSPWKKTRWTLCALKNGNHAAEPSTAENGGGLALYVKSCHDQNVTPPAQPISPCARRTWDETASPWDYTP